MRLTLKSKVLLLAMVPVLLFALVLSGGAVLILKKQADAEVKDTRERLLGDRRAELEHYVQIAMGSACSWRSWRRISRPSRPGSMMSIRIRS